MIRRRAVLDTDNPPGEAREKQHPSPLCYCEDCRNLYDYFPSLELTDEERQKLVTWGDN